MLRTMLVGWPNREGLARMLLVHLEGPTLEKPEGARAHRPYTMTGGITYLTQKETT
jgi:hypothetical protein